MEKELKVGSRRGSVSGGPEDATEVGATAITEVGATAITEQCVEMGRPWPATAAASIRSTPVASSCAAPTPRRMHLQSVSNNHVERRESGLGIRN